MRKFKVVITGKGKLWDVDFLIGKDVDKNIKFKYSSDRKKWVSEEFVCAGSEFSYKLIVYARRGTGWEGRLEEVGKPIPPVIWELSKINQKHESVRTRPVINVIA
ncbi:hypothetical protein [Lewinella sp. LCG006]|uniref:hypothetical protein n=1 Tax=Lewinella sp. LCG006 TaxID=3231911 RepID=UPI00345F281C